MISHAVLIVLAHVAVRFAHVRSYHADLVSPTGRASTADYAAPNRYRLATPMGDLIVTGTRTYLHAGAQWIAMSAPQVQPTVAALREPATLGATLAHATVSDLGPATLGDRRVHRYRVDTVEDGRPLVATLWIGADGLPYRDDLQSGTSELSVAYSGYNAPIAIAVPPQSKPR